MTRLDRPLSDAERAVLAELARGFNVTCAKIGDALYSKRRALKGAAPHARTVGRVMNALRARGYAQRVSGPHKRRGLVTWEVTATGHGVLRSLVP